MLVIGALMMGGVLLPLNGEEVKRTKAEKEVLEVLQKFQAGYTAKDASKVDEYVAELFDPEDALIAGTISYGPKTREWCEGIEAITHLVKYDWEHWDDLKMLVDEARIRVNGNIAWVAMWGTSEGVKVKEDEYKRALLEFARIIEKNKERKAEGINLAVILHVLKKTSRYLHRYVQEGNEYVYPIRVTIVLKKKKGKWLVQFMDFAFPDDDIPDVMLYR
jgi:ketosteroid isomerase-like protein